MSPRKASSAASSCSRVTETGWRLERLAARVLRIRHKAEAQPGQIFLAVALRKLDGPRRPPHKQDEHAGRHRVERAAVADAPLMEHAAQLRRHVLAASSPRACPRSKCRLPSSDDPFPAQHVQNGALRARDAARDCRPGRRSMSAAAQLPAELQHALYVPLVRSESFPFPSSTSRTVMPSSTPSIARAKPAIESTSSSLAPNSSSHACGSSTSATFPSA